MTSARVGRGIAVAAIALGIAGAGAAVNLRLIEAHDQRVEPLSLTTGSGPGTTGAPPSTGPPATQPGSTTTTTTTTSTGPTTTPAVAGATSHRVGAAGTVVLSVNDGAISVVSVQVTDGWTYETERPSGAEVELEFRRAADGAETSLHAHLEDGHLRVETEDDGPDD